MKLLYASEYRAAARSMLRGRWTEAVLVGLVASLLCGNINLGSSSAFRMNINLDTNSLSSQFGHMPEDANGIEWLMHLLTGGLAALCRLVVAPVRLGGRRIKKFLEKRLLLLRLRVL